MPNDLPPYRDSHLPVETRIDDLLARMTLGEKIDQLHQCGLGDVNPNNLAARFDEFRATYGSFIQNGAYPDLTLRNALQRRCVEESRLGIPAIFGCDVIHGYRAIWPIPLAQACTWDPALVERACRIAAEMARAQGVDWTFAPMVDHCVDPRWGRIAETFGESPHASAVFAAASVRGYQGEQIGAPNSIAACLKHYAGYGASEGGRDYTFTSIGEQQLWEKHLPPFEAGVRAGALSVMSAFNDLNGTPTSAHRGLLTEILRQKWGFDGLVVSDWNAVLQLLHQGHVADGAEAAERALMAGVDLNMADGLYREHLPHLVRDGRVPLAAVDEAVRRVLRVKFRLGLFERPFVEPGPLAGSPPTEAQRAFSREIAQRSLVLLKNDGALLPLAPGRRLALIGPLARDSGALLGSWAQQGRADETPNLADTLRGNLPSEDLLIVETGCAIEGGGREGLAAAVAAAQAADVCVLCLGEQWSMSGENASRASIRLPGLQEELAQAVIATGKPVVLLLVSGRPLEIAALEPQVRAIVAAWQLGTEAAAAIVDVLLGRVSPAGRLAVTWPRTAGQIPLYHHERPRARLGAEGTYQDIATTPLYPFGHGLSYTTFRAGPLRLSADTVAADGRITAEVEIENTGTCAAHETVLWFVRDPAASITRPLRELKHFESALIPAGGRRVFRWTIVPERDLSFPDSTGCRRLEAGEFRVMVGEQTASFRLHA